ncbi:hypothetical protein NIES2100_79920 (plasmid) [Calothrix sp. NIES-2100]|uniref:hypothetical protein n=1 Tax=Calothrix sp. NIES-2100 TaxID=1954172 RepID=UPI000B61D4FD|nr:hypothetical protein NIES2100_79920 [Calothrix sp. NIES-2100]
MVSKGVDEDEALKTTTEQASEGIELRSGGCAGIDEIGWSQKLGRNLSTDEIEAKVEHLRQQLLENSDVKKVRNTLKKCDITKNEQLIALVKRYNFDSPGITFTPENYYSWTKLADGKCTINDVRYLVHEIAEVEELRCIQQQNGFDFMATNWDNMTRRKKQEWRTDFKYYYMQAHSKALEAEYDFLAKKVSDATNSEIPFSRIVAAAIDPSRDEARRYMLVDGISLEEHPNFSDWQLRAKEIVKLNRKQRLRLGFTVNPQLNDLLRAVKQIKLY